MAATGARSAASGVNWRRSSYDMYQRGNLPVDKFVHQYSTTSVANAAVPVLLARASWLLRPVLLQYLYVPAGAGPRPARLRRTLPERTATVRADDCVRICGMTARARAAAERA